MNDPRVSGRPTRSVEPRVSPPRGTCGAYYGTGQQGVGWAICVRFSGHPAISEDGIGHSDVPGDSIPAQWDAGEARAAAARQQREGGTVNSAQQIHPSQRVQDVLDALGLTLGGGIEVQYAGSAETWVYRLDDVRFLGSDPVLWVSAVTDTDRDLIRIPYPAIANVRVSEGTP